MKVNLNSLTKLSHPERYTNLLDSLKKNRSILENHIKTYTSENSEEYDKIIKEYEKNKHLVEMFRTFTANHLLMMQDIHDSISRHQESFIKNSNIKELCLELGLDGKFKEHEISMSKNISEIYAKVQENSNMIIIYDLEKKKFHQIKNDDWSFNAKCYSYYCQRERCIYVSGGVRKNQETNVKLFSDSFIQIRVEINYNQFDFKFEENLAPMNFSRANHCMIEYGNDYFIVVSGINTQTCEIYSKKKDSWGLLPSIGSKLPNPALALLNQDTLYCFNGSANHNSIDGIYKLSLKNFEKHGEKGFEDFLSWEKVDYYFPGNCEGKLKRGMAALAISTTSILLFGGFNFDNLFDSIYDFNLNKPKNSQGRNPRNKEQLNKLDSEIQEDVESNHVNHKEEPEYSEEESEFYENAVNILDTDLSLPIKTFFNSNILIFDYYLIMIDGHNNALELNLKTQEFFYYT
jgi:hypothetical protein